jgi:hypothetical protein
MVLMVTVTVHAAATMAAGHEEDRGEESDPQPVRCKELGHDNHLTSISLTRLSIFRPVAASALSTESGCGRLRTAGFGVAAKPTTCDHDTGRISPQIAAAMRDGLGSGQEPAGPSVRGTQREPEGASLVGLDGEQLVNLD